MPPLFIRQLRSRTDKGVSTEEGKRRWRIFLFISFFSYFDARKPNKIKSARPRVFHIMLQRGMQIWGASPWRARGMIRCCLYSLKENEWMAAAGSIKAFYIDCCHSGAARMATALLFHRWGMMQDEKWGDEETQSLVWYLHVSQAELWKPQAHTAINHLASVLPF